MNSPLLHATGISKRFPGVTALDGVDLAVDAGEVVAVVGENGAGKSTLMRILAGVEHPDAGTLQVQEQEISFRGRTSADAIRSGIALIHQELELCDNIDVAGNILLGREPRHGPCLDRARAHTQATAAMAMVGLDLDPSSSIEGLGIGHRQLIEIAKALSADARILIMDEPTASLTLSETTRLIEVVDELRARGTAIIYITHRLREVERLADRVLVLRDGVGVGGLTKEQISHDAMVRLMIGREVTRLVDRTPARPGNDRLHLREFRSHANPAHPVDLTLRAGEVVGLAGLVGSGRTELLRSMFGIDQAAGGEILIDGRLLQGGSPARAMACGLALVPEDRKADGLFLEESVRDNLVISILKRLGHAWFRSGREERRTAAKAIHEFGVRAPHDRVAIAELSGGNQQKVSLAKWILTEPRVLLLDEPTRGVDVGAKEEIYALIDRLVSQGVAILVASSEMEEVLALSDRVLVMHEGRLAGELSGAEASEESIMQLATGREVAA